MYIEDRGLRQVVACVVGESAGGEADVLRKVLSDNGFSPMNLPTLDPYGSGDTSKWAGSLKAVWNFLLPSPPTFVIKTRPSILLPHQVAEQYGNELSGLLLVEAPRSGHLTNTPFHVFRDFLAVFTPTQIGHVLPVLMTTPDSYAHIERALPGTLDRNSDKAGVTRWTTKRKSMGEDMDQLLRSFKDRTTRQVLRMPNS